MYTGNLKIPLKPKTVIQLLLAANKFEILEINEDIIDAELMSRINPRNFWLFCAVAQDATLTTLASHVENWIQFNFKSIVEDEYFLTFKKTQVSIYLLQTLRIQVMFLVVKSNILSKFVSLIYHL